MNHIVLYYIQIKFCFLCMHLVIMYLCRVHYMKSYLFVVWKYNKLYLFMCANICFPPTVHMIPWFIVTLMVACGFSYTCDNVLDIHEKIYIFNEFQNLFRNVGEKQVLCKGPEGSDSPCISLSHY